MTFWRVRNCLKGEERSWVQFEDQKHWYGERADIIKKASWRFWQDKAKFERRKQGAGKSKSCTCGLDRNSIC